MGFLRITPGVSAFSSGGRPLPPQVHAPDESLRATVFARDANRCQYCGFTCARHQEINYTGQRVAKGQKPKARKRGALPPADDYVTACTFCHQCFHLESIDRMQSGALIWLPEIGQAALNHICRAIYVARISQGPMAEAARDSMESLLARKAEAVARLGTDSPAILASVLQDFLESGEYKRRGERLNGFRILPLDRRIVRKGELEFNEFPQTLAFWRAKEGPFGEHPPRLWVKTFYDVRQKLAG